MQQGLRSGMHNMSFKERPGTKDSVGTLRHAINGTCTLCKEHKRLTHYIQQLRPYKNEDGHIDHSTEDQSYTICEQCAILRKI